MKQNLVRIGLDQLPDVFMPVLSENDAGPVFIIKIVHLIILSAQYLHYSHQLGIKSKIIETSSFFY